MEIEYIVLESYVTEILSLSIWHVQDNFCMVLSSKSLSDLIIEICGVIPKCLSDLIECWGGVVFSPWFAVTFNIGEQCKNEMFFLP